MPNTNALLLLGLGLAALTMFRRDQANADETDLVDASMLSSGTGRTGEALKVITTVNDDTPAINTNGTAAIDKGANGTPAVVGFDLQGWLASLNIGAPAAVAETPVVNEDLPNVKTGPAQEVTVSPFIQTPEYIRTTGELAGTAVRQLGITLGDQIDLINPKIYVQEIAVAEPDSQRQPLTMTEDVHIVAGGANPGEAYFTTLDVLAAARDQGWFDPPREELRNGALPGMGSSDVFDAVAGSAANADIVEPLTQTGGIPVAVSKGILSDTWRDPFTGGLTHTVVPVGFDRETVSSGGFTHPDAFWLEG